MAKGLIIAATVEDGASIASGTPLASITPKENGAMAILVEFGAAAALSYQITPDGGSAVVPVSKVNDGISLNADSPQTFVLIVRAGTKYDFHHTAGGSIRIKQFLANIINIGVI